MTHQAKGIEQPTGEKKEPPTTEDQSRRTRKGGRHRGEDEKVKETDTTPTDPHHRPLRQ